MSAALDDTRSISLLSNTDSMNILAVEDDVVSMAFLQAQIADLGHAMVAANNGAEALRTLREQRGSIDVVLMDREMPEMDGLTAVRRMKDDPELRSIPVIMITGADSLGDTRAGLDAGVFYYLTKPVEEEMLRSVLSAAVRQARQVRTLGEELSRHRTSFHLIDSCRFAFRTLSEAESLAAFMANCFPNPERVLPGLAELLINAVEHGIVGLGYERKTEFVDAGTWRAEVERILDGPDMADRKATATVARKPEGVYAVIEDPGRGFDWKQFMRIDPARAGDNHGRGIAQANATSFDKLTYNDTGNKAVAFVSADKQLEW